MEGLGHWHFLESCGFDQESRSKWQRLTAAVPEEGKSYLRPSFPFLPPGNRPQTCQIFCFVWSQKSRLVCETPSV